MKGGPQEGVCVDPAGDGKAAVKMCDTAGCQWGAGPTPLESLGTQGGAPSKLSTQRARTGSPHWRQAVPSSLSLPQEHALDSECRETGCLQAHPSLSAPSTKPNHQDPAPTHSACAPDCHLRHHYRDCVLRASCMSSMLPYVVLTTTLTGRTPSGQEATSGSASK